MEELSTWAEPVGSEYGLTVAEIKADIVGLSYVPDLRVIVDIDARKPRAPVA